MVRTLTASWPQLTMTALAAAALVYWTRWPSLPDVSEPPLSRTCAAWDRDASVGIALLVPDPSSLAEAQLDYALYQLRRARKNCRIGRTDFAREDYRALQDAHPFPNRQASRRGAPAHQESDR